jgi:hypothetical protein
MLLSKKNSLEYLAKALLYLWQSFLVFFWRLY